MGLIREGKGGPHGQILINRNHDRYVHQSPEVPETDDLEFAEEVCGRLGNRVSFIDKAEKSWSKFSRDRTSPILLNPGKPGEELRVLPDLSSVVKGLRPVSQTRIRPLKRKTESARIVESLSKKRRAKHGH